MHYFRSLSLFHSVTTTATRCCGSRSVPITCELVEEQREEPVKQTTERHTMAVKREKTSRLALMVITWFSR